jgi:hypothetical protein
MKTLFIALWLAGSVTVAGTAYGDIPWEFGTARGHAQQQQANAVAAAMSQRWAQYTPPPVWSSIGPVLVPWNGRPQMPPPGIRGGACYAGWMGGPPSGRC